MTSFSVVDASRDRISSEMTSFVPAPSQKGLDVWMRANRQKYLVNGKAFQVQIQRVVSSVSVHRNKVWVSFLNFEHISVTDPKLVHESHRPSTAPE